MGHKDQNRAFGLSIHFPDSVQLGNPSAPKLPRIGTTIFREMSQFRMAKEHGTFEAGQRRVVVELKGWRVLPLVLNIT